MITVTYQNQAACIESDADVLIELPNVALGRLIDFEQIEKHSVLAVYWVGHTRLFNEMVPPAQLMQSTPPNIPYQSLFIMSIIKSDLIMFNKLYKYIKSPDLEICPAICMWQFTDQIERKETVAQGILTLFRYIRVNRKQNTMLNAVLKKLPLSHVVSQVYILECDKYNIAMYNIIAAHVGQVVKWSGVSVGAQWSTWPYINMPQLNQELPSNLCMTGPDWPGRAQKPGQLNPCSPGNLTQPTTGSPGHASRVRLSKRLAPQHRQEMAQCSHLNPTLKNAADLSYASLSRHIRIGPAIPGYYIHDIAPDNGQMPRATQDVTDLLCLAPARPVALSWPLKHSA